MTTTTNETVEGTVETTNERGLRLKGETEWRNYSKFASDLELASRGATVRLSLDSKGFIRVIDTLAAAPTTSNGTVANSSPTRDRTITRLAVLKAAANFCGLMSQTRQEIKSSDVVLLAARWVAWVERESDVDSPP